ncbi:MAG: LLM class flavin-dependent oxidoreductase [Alphaproteobacteria bacterium]
MTASGCLNIDCVETGYNPAPFVALAALAQVTKTCKLGTQPLLLALRNPVLVAEEAAVLDVLSGGRLILGIGAGYRVGDFEALGIDKRERGARMEEATALLIKMFTAEAPFDHAGRFFQVKGGALYPKPVQAPYPEIQIIARSEAAAMRAVRHATSINLHRRDVVQTLGPLVADATRKAGRDPAKVRVSVLRHGFLGPTRERAIETAKPYLTWNAQEHGSWWSDNPDPDDQALFKTRVVGAANPPGDYTAEEWLAGIQGRHRRDSGGRSAPGLDQRQHLAARHVAGRRACLSGTFRRNGAAPPARQPLNHAASGDP